METQGLSLQDRKLRSLSLQVGSVEGSLLLEYRRLPAGDIRRTETTFAHGYATSDDVVTTVASIVMDAAAEVRNWGGPLLQLDADGLHEAELVLLARFLAPEHQMQAKVGGVLLSLV